MATTQSKRAAKSPEAVAILHVLPVGGKLKRPALQNAMTAFLGAEVSDEAFELAMKQMQRRLIRQRGVGGGITRTH